MQSILHFVTTGLLLGLYAGLTPGPILTLVISESLKSGRKAGFRIAFAPLISDAVVLTVTFTALYFFSRSGVLLGILGLAGSVLVAWLGYKNITASPFSLTESRQNSVSLWQAALVNILNPNPYIFWLTIGGPLFIKGWKAGYLPGLLFMLMFYLMLVGSNLTMAVIVSKVRHRFNTRLFTWVIRFLGLALVAMAVYLFWNGWKLLS